MVAETPISVEGSFSLGPQTWSAPLFPVVLCFMALRTENSSFVVKQGGLGSVYFQLAV